MNTYGMGFDFGNSHATGVISVSGQERLLTLPSSSAPGSLDDYAAMIAGSGVSSMTPFDVLRTHEYVLHYKGTERFVGKLALSQTRQSSTGRGDTNRYGSTRSLELLLTIAGALIPEDTFSLLVVTGLPIETFKSEDVRKKVKHILNNPFHEFTLNGRTKHAQIKVGKLLMEGAGAAMALHMPKGRRCAIVDIGEFTTDVYAAQGLEAISPQCGGTEIGMSHACQYVNRLFYQKYKRHLTDLEQTTILHAFLDKSYPVLSAPYAEVDSMDLDTWMFRGIQETGKIVNEHISRLLHAVDSTGIVAGDFHQVQISGGGAYYLTDKIKEIISAHKVQCSSEPEHDNARGYAWFADQLVQNRSAA